MEKPTVMVDIVIFSIRDKKLQVLLIKRKVSPFKDMWAIPGGRVDIHESLEEAAMRELAEETNVRNVYLEQLYSFGDPKRDPRGRVITVAYYALINSQNLQIKSDTDAADVGWYAVSNLPKLAFDHKNILEYAIKRVKWKFGYTLVAFSMLPKKFTMTELQELYETVFEKKFDKRNFRKKILSLNILDEEEVKREVSHRPPQMYSVKKDVHEIVEIL